MLRRVAQNSLTPLYETYPDLLWNSAATESYRSKVGLAEKLRHILFNSSGAFQVPELVLHLFSMRRTHDTDFRSYFHARIASNTDGQCIATTTTSEFEERIRNENAALNRIRNKTSSLNSERVGNGSNH